MDKKNKNANYGSNHYWTLSPNLFTGSISDMFIAGLIGNIGNNSSNSYNGVSPAIALKPDVIISGGTGTQSNPFVVQ